MSRNARTKLFVLQAYLQQDGNILLECESVSPSDFESVMNKGMPDYEGTYSVTSLLRYLIDTGNEVLEKSKNFI